MIYLASPYSHPDPEVRIERFNAAATKMADLAKQGVHAYSPILHWHPVAIAHELPTDHLFWQINNHIHIAHSEAVWVLQLEGWQESHGIKDEIEYANNIGIPVGYVDKCN